MDAEQQAPADVRTGCISTRTWNRFFRYMSSLPLKTQRQIFFSCLAATAFTLSCSIWFINDLALHWKFYIGFLVFILTVYFLLKLHKISTMRYPTNSLANLVGSVPSVANSASSASTIVNMSDDGVWDDTNSVTNDEIEMSTFNATGSTVIPVPETNPRSEPGTSGNIVGGARSFVKNSRTSRSIRNKYRNRRAPSVKAGRGLRVSVPPRFPTIAEASSDPQQSEASTSATGARPKSCLKGKNVSRRSAPTKASEEDTYDATMHFHTNPAFNLEEDVELARRVMELLTKISLGEDTTDLGLPFDDRMNFLAAVNRNKRRNLNNASGSRRVVTYTATISEDSPDVPASGLNSRNMADHRYSAPGAVPSNYPRPDVYLGSSSGPRNLAVTNPSAEPRTSGQPGVMGGAYGAAVLDSERDAALQLRAAAAFMSPLVTENKEAESPE